MKRFFSNKINIYLSISFALAIVSLALIINRVLGPTRYLLDKEDFGRDFKSVTISNSQEVSMGEFLEGLSTDNNVIYGNPVMSYVNNGQVEKSLIVYPTLEKQAYIFKNRKVEGEYLSSSNINRNVAVIGKSLQDMCVLENGKKILEFEFDNEKFRYEVIGIINEDEYLNNSVFIPYESVYNTALGNIKSTQYNVLIPSKEDLNIRNTNFKIEGVNDYTKQSKLEIIAEQVKVMYKDIQNLILCAILCVINSMIFSIFWVKSNKKKIAIFKVLGANNLYIFSYIFTKIIIIGLIGAISSSVIVFGLSKLIYLNDVFHISTMIIAILATIIISIVSTICSYIDILRFNIKKYVR